MRDKLHTDRIAQGFLRAAFASAALRESVQAPPVSVGAHFFLTPRRDEFYRIV